MKPGKTAANLIATLMLLALTAVALTLAQTSQDAISAVSEAERLLAEAYKKAADAERAGANTTELVPTLERAGRYLSDAKIALSQGLYDNAFAFATQSQVELTGFSSRAESLKNSAEQSRILDVLVNVVGPLLGAVGVGVAGLVVWGRVSSRMNVQRPGDGTQGS